MLRIVDNSSKGDKADGKFVGVDGGYRKEFPKTDENLLIGGS